VAVGIASLIDQAQLVSNNRRNAAIAAADWVTFVNWAIESWYKFRISLDPSLYFSTVDFTLPGGANGSTFNLDLAFAVRLSTTGPLPAFTASGGPGPGKTLTATANGALSVDGVAVVAGDLILYAPVFANATSGIYRVAAPGTAGTPYILQRYSGFDEAGPLEVQVGAIVTSTAGTTFANDPFILTAFGGTVDVSPQTWIVDDVRGRFRALHGVDVNPDTGSRYTLRSRNFRQRNQGVGWWVPTAWCPIRFYDVRANLLAITPYEQSAGNYRAYFRAAPYKFATPTDGDPLDAVLEPEVEALALLAACSADGIEENDFSDKRIKRINVIKAEVTASYQRDDGQAFQIADVEDLGNGF
jgi:hypothetical protein